MLEGLSFDDVLLKPQHGVLESRSEADISSELFSGINLQVPIISANMPAVTGPEMAIAMDKAGGIGALHRFNSIEDAVDQFRQVVNSPKLFWRYPIVSIGYKDGIERAVALYKHGARFFCLDVAHGDHNLTIRFINKLQEVFGWPDTPNDFKLIVGNIATAEAVGELPISKIDAFKVGIGPGAACRTREVTGFGVPQLSAIMHIKSVLDYWRNYDCDIKLIADGGIKNSGDIVKALAAGADTVMIGRLLAGCDEAPNGLEYFGNASAKLNGHRAPEGAHGLVEASGSVEDVMKELAWGIKSGVSYGGGRNLKDLRENAEWIRVSPLTTIESSVRI